MTNASTLTFKTSSPALEALGYQITARLSLDGRSTHWAWVNHVTGARGVSRGSKVAAESFARSDYVSLTRAEQQACREFGHRAARERANAGETVEIGSQAAKHAYQVGVLLDGQVMSVQVNASTRTQAAAIATEHGFEVRDVNMIG